MDLTTLLSPDDIRVFPGVTSKKRLFQEIGEMVEARFDLPRGTTFDALQERESLGPTGVGNGIALPHARLNGLDHVSACFLRLERPLDFGSPDRLPVDLVFSLFAPEDAGVDHLKALALVSRTMRDPALCVKLRANEDPATLYALLTNRPTPRAA